MRRRCRLLDGGAGFWLWPTKNGVAPHPRQIAEASPKLTAEECAHGDGMLHTEGAPTCAGLRNWLHRCSRRAMRGTTRMPCLQQRVSVSGRRRAPLRNTKRSWSITSHVHQYATHEGVWRSWKARAATTRGCQTLKYNGYGHITYMKALYCVPHWGNKRSTLRVGQRRPGAMP